MPSEPGSGQGMGNPDPPPPDRQSNDAWNAVGYLLAGLIVYGGIGYAVDRWLGTKYWTLLGLLLGGALGVYLVHVRYGRR